MTITLTLTAADGATHQITLPAPTVSAPVVSAPAAPAISFTRTVSAQSSFWNVTNGGTSSSNNHNAFGTSSSPGATITVYVDGTSVGTTTADASGNWSKALGILSDATHAITATATSGGQTSPQSATFSLTIVPSILNFTNTPWATTMTNTGKMIQPECAAVSYALENPNTHQLRMELRPGDRSSGDGTHVERAEVACGAAGYNTIVANNNIFRCTYEYFLEAGAASDSQWCVIYQWHNDDVALGVATSPPVTLALQGSDFTFGNWTQGDYLVAEIRWWNASLGGTANDSSKSQKIMAYRSSAPLARNVWHTVEMEGRPNNAGNGYLKIWVDGAQIVNYTGNLGFGAGFYPEWGFYRASCQQDGSTPTKTTQAAHYRNHILVLQ